MTTPEHQREWHGWFRWFWDYPPSRYAIMSLVYLFLGLWMLWGEWRIMGGVVLLMASTESTIKMNASKGTRQ